MATNSVEPVAANGSEEPIITRHAEVRSSQAASDEAMQRELNMKLATDPQLAFHPLDATVENGRVRLRGTLPNERLKERTESIAKSIRGVKEISNQISIQPG